MRPALTVLAAGTIAAAALLVPGAASADTHVAWPPASPHRVQPRVVDPGNDITWTVVDHKIAVLTPDDVVVPIQYTCGTTAAPENRQYAPGVFQATLMDATAAASEATTGDTPPVGVTLTCDGVQHVVNVSADWQPTMGGDTGKDGGFEYGNIEVGLFDVATQSPALFEHAIVGTDGLDDTRASVAVTVNATPESTRPGKKITVKGTVKRNGHAYKGKYTKLYFQSADGQPAQKVGSDHASSKGNLETEIKAIGAGTYFWVTSSTTKTQAGATLGDYAAAGTSTR